MSTTEAAPSRGRRVEVPQLGGDLDRKPDDRHSTGADSPADVDSSTDAGKDWTAVTITAATPRPGVPFYAHCRMAIAPPIAAGTVSISAAAFGMRRADPNSSW